MILKVTGVLRELIRGWDSRIVPDSNKDNLSHQERHLPVAVTNPELLSNTIQRRTEDGLNHRASLATTTRTWTVFTRWKFHKTTVWRSHSRTSPCHRKPPGGSVTLTTLSSKTGKVKEEVAWLGDFVGTSDPSRFCQVDVLCGLISWLTTYNPSMRDSKWTSGPYTKVQ